MDHGAVAARIRSARKALGLSQGALGRRLGVHRATVAHWERADGFVPSVDNLRVLSKELQVDFEWLAVGRMTGKTEPSSAAPSSRRDLESRLLQLSRHVPVSFLATVVALLESASTYLE
ncbi:helix-turn-helix transcriptional regulator [Xanthomonas hyacinthi]|uniref:XRE family transcriptional regulator n=1 Tax=Xanthomonas hyacinthi TaxID=56455 RepID=A0A2S7EZS2_9XANT|nr:helix-turn-helix transcriptional regulator [Xanthomonas hyacinthi]KLD79221.1 RstR family transcriptional regulator [Xanthomonas hyacinthi DSM 19077]PPU98654.1 XRE family transcriptional regulator [Xanthomonas hyacinthi]QGY77469.1 helix-turn-helix transcriptional regulator [Xanthomonas hyacinthi]